MTREPDKPAPYLVAGIVAAILVGVALYFLADAAHGREFRSSIRFTPVVPTVAGIREPRPFRPRIFGVVRSRPDAGVYEIRGAGPNGCEAAGGGFLVASGPASGRGCYGGP